MSGSAIKSKSAGDDAAEGPSTAPAAAAAATANEGDWICPEPECANMNFARRSACNRCGKDKPVDNNKKKCVGIEIGKAAAEKSRGLFSADDWQCTKCGNLNWARRSSCNVCNAPKFKEVEERTGYGGGYNDRGIVEYIEREESDDEYDEFGRKKKKFRNIKVGESQIDYDKEKAKAEREFQINCPVKKIEDDDDDEEEEEEEDDDDDDEDGDLSKYDLSDWGTEKEEGNGEAAEGSKTEDATTSSKVEESNKPVSPPTPLDKEEKSSSSSSSRSSRSRSTSKTRSTRKKSRSRSRDKSRSRSRDRNRRKQRSRSRDKDKRKSRDKRSRSRSRSRGRDKKHHHRSRSRSRDRKRR